MGMFHNPLRITLHYSIGSINKTSKQLTSMLFTLQTLPLEVLSVLSPDVSLLSVRRGVKHHRISHQEW